MLSWVHLLTLNTHTYAAKNKNVPVYFNDFNKKRLKQELDLILNSEKRKQLFLDYYDLEKKLGGKGASEKTAKLIYKSLQD